MCNCITQLNVPVLFSRSADDSLSGYTIAPLQPKVRIMTAGAVTVLCSLKEPWYTDCYASNLNSVYHQVVHSSCAYGAN